MEAGKTYIIGLRIIDGNVFSNGYVHGIVEFDPNQESENVIFSGKREAIIAMGEAQLDDFALNCMNVINFQSNEDFQKRYLDGCE